MPAWKEAQYVIDELGRKIDEKGTGVMPPKVIDAMFAYWGGGYVDIFIPYDKMPGSIIINGNEIVRAKSIACVKGTDHCPKDISDGIFLGEKDIVMVNETEGHVIAFKDRAEESSTVYYSLFTKSTQGTYSEPYEISGNANISHTSSGNPHQFINVYGGYNKLTVLDPIERVTYYNDENEKHQWYFITPKLGAWDSYTSDDMLSRRRLLTHILKNYPAAVNDDGTVRYWLDPKDYKKKIDGTPSDWDNPNFDGNFCAWIETMKIINHLNASGSYRYPVFSDNLIGPEVYVNDGFKDWDGNVLKGIWIPMLYQGRDDARHFTSHLWDDLFPVSAGGKGLNKTCTQLREELVSLASIDSTHRRVPLMNYITMATIRNIYEAFAMNMNSQQAFGKGFSGTTVQNNALRVNTIVDDGTMLPGFSFDGVHKMYEQYVKGLHSIVFLSSLAPIPEWSSKISRSSKSGGLFTSYNWKNLLPNPKEEKVFDTPYFSSARRAYYTGGFAFSPGAHYAEAIVPQSTDLTVSSSLLGNCDSFYENNVPGHFLMLNFQSPMYGSDASGLYTVEILNTIYDANIENPTLNTPWFVLPQPDYDPFEATGYYPWLDEE